MDLPGRTVRLTALLAVPALLLTACGDATSSRSATDDPTTSPTATPSQSEQPTDEPSQPPTSSATAEPDPDWPVTLSFKGLERGAPPAMPFLRVDPDAPGGWSLVEPDGEERPLSRSYSQFAPMGEGLVGLAYENDRVVAYLLDGDLDEVSRSEALDGPLAVTPDGSIVGWLGADHKPHYVEDGGGRQGWLPEVRGGASLAAILVDGTTCQEGQGGNGCAAFVNSADSSLVWSSVSHGIVDRVPGIIFAGDVADDGGLLGMTSVSDEGSCWGLFKTWKPEPRWETCGYTLFDFSPSGERILAGPAYLDGFGQGVAAVLDRSGEVLAEWHSNGKAAILGTTWEDEDHVLVSAFQDEKWAVLRVGLDGTVELALPPVPDPGAGGAYVLPVR